MIKSLALYLYIKQAPAATTTHLSLSHPPRSHLAPSSYHPPCASQHTYCVMQQDSSSSSSEKPAQITAAAHNNTSADNNSYSHTTPASDQIRAVVRTQWADDDFLPPSADRKLDDARMGVMTDLEAANDNNNDNDNDSDTASGQVVHASDFKRKQEFSGIYLLWFVNSPSSSSSSSPIASRFLFQPYYIS